MVSLFKLINKRKPQLREQDPSALQRTKEGAYLVKLISETEVTARKCDFFAGNATDARVRDFFQQEGAKIRRAKLTMERYYESMTRE